MMIEKLKPAGSMLAAATFICQICLGGLILQLFVPLGCGAQPAELPDLERELKESASIWHISSMEHSSADFMAKSQPGREKINLEGNDTSATVSELKAFNCNKERDITCETQQFADGDADRGQFANSLDVSVSGSPDQAEKAWPGGAEMEDVESIVDRAFGDSHLDRIEQISGQGEISDAGRRSEKGDKGDLFSNNLNIDVHGITVSAINTVEGGSATATSNIIIKPVQMIVIPPEVEAKLK
ncbi:MAG TPA: hypothetical protein PLQ01_01320 [Methanothrix sp.]|nr:hypothetical protein [Methanothrix sp.]